MLKVINNVFVYFLIGIIMLYRLLFSPVSGPCCRFMPSCSTYAIEALKTHGFLKGSWLFIKRFSKCHPIKWLNGGQGYDPVPAPSKKPKTINAHSTTTIKGLKINE